MTFLYPSWDPVVPFLMHEGETKDTRDIFAIIRPRHVRYRFADGHYLLRRPPPGEPEREFHRRLMKQASKRAKSA